MKLVSMSHQGKLTAYSTQLTERERMVVLYSLLVAVGRQARMIVEDKEIESLIHDLQGESD